MITVKIGGSVVDDLHPSVVADIKKVIELEEVILVHGGGKEVTKVTEQLGKEPKFVISPGGVKSRYTDLETAEIFTMVMSGRINKTIVRMLQKNGIDAVGLSGIDGKIIQAESFVYSGAFSHGAGLSGSLVRELPGIGLRNDILESIGVSCISIAIFISLRCTYRCW